MGGTSGASTTSIRRVFNDNREGIASMGRMGDDGNGVEKSGKQHQASKLI